MASKLQIKFDGNDNYIIVIYPYLINGLEKRNSNPNPCFLGVAIFSVGVKKLNS